MPPPVSAPWWRRFRTCGEVRVLHVDLAPEGTREEAAPGWLDGEEQERWSRYPYTGPQRQFLLCRAALRAILCEWLGCENEDLAFPTTEEGKPWAAVAGEPAPVSFNVSHSGRHGLIAVAPRGRLGIDVEELGPRRNLDLLMDGVLGEEERGEIASMEGDSQLRSFFRIWTMKEALLKAQGRGLLEDATAFQVPRAMRRGARKGTIELPRLPGVTWQLDDLGGEHFAAALAHDID
jgi:4'-phosphopantetheinyl transferase